MDWDAIVRRYEERQQADAIRWAALRAAPPVATGLLTAATITTMALPSGVEILIPTRLD